MAVTWLINIILIKTKSGVFRDIKYLEKWALTNSNLKDSIKINKKQNG